jgi:GNAT superfamily N-acetyltransferase
VNTSRGGTADRGVNAWYVRQGPDTRPGRYRTHCYIGDQHADATLHLTADAAGDISSAILLWETTFDERGRVHINVNQDFAPNCPPLWFVSVLGRESEVQPVHYLVAFDTDHVPPGTVVDDPEFLMMKVRNDQQVAAIEWGKQTGTVHQLYVHKDRRRSDVGTHLIYAASAYHQTHGWPGRLNSDGKRTVLGQEFAISLLHGQRIEKLTNLAPPMDKPE